MKTEKGGPLLLPHVPGTTRDLGWGAVASQRHPVPNNRFPQTSQALSGGSSSSLFLGAWVTGAPTLGGDWRSRVGLGTPDKAPVVGVSFNAPILNALITLNRLSQLNQMPEEH